MQNHIKQQEEIEFIQKYKGRLLREEDFSSYEKWALYFFHKQDHTRDSCLQVTLQIDITKAMEHYTRHYKQMLGASFTAYLMWCVVQTAKKHPCFRYRKIQGQWYIFDELPLSIPIAVGGDVRFADLNLEPITNTKLEAFFTEYRSSQDALFAQTDKKARTSGAYWENSWFIGNLPHLQFTAFQLHKPNMENGKPFFYFGKRYMQEGKKMTPLSIYFDHANLDPFLLSAYMHDFQKLIEGANLEAE